MKKNNSSDNGTGHLDSYYRDIIDAGRDPLVVITPDMHCVFANQAARDILAVEKGSCRSKPCFAVIHGHDNPCWEQGKECPVREAFASGETVRTIQEMAIHSSLVRTYEISAVPIKNENGDVTAVIEILRDITASRDHMELKKISAKIEQAKKEWEATMDCVQDFIILLDDAGRIKRLNKALVKFSGLPFTQILGQEFKSFLSTHDLKQDSDSTDSNICEYFHDPSGRSFSMRTYPLTMSEGEMRVITLHDITQRKFAAKQLAVKNKEIEQAFTELKTAQSHLLQQEKMASVGQLAAGVAHEINNPVGFVTSNINTMAKYLDKISLFIELQNKFVKKYCPDEDKVKTLQEHGRKLKIDFIINDTKDLIAESLDGVERVKKIVMNLKNFSRVDQAERASVNINTCLDDTINIAWNELKYKCTLHKEYGELPALKCYPQQLNQVFINLLINAAQAFEKTGEITIKTWCTDAAIFVTITDNGYGIAEDKISHIFEPFFTTKDVGKGTGLGLSISYDIIVNKHHGDLTVASEEGKGTTFTITLPFIEE